jgi:S1-C subfamily serine protease
MKALKLPVLLFALLTLSLMIWPASADSGSKTYHPTIQVEEPSSSFAIVRLLCIENDGQVTKTGSGTIIRSAQISASAGIIYTNFHVVEDCAEIGVEMLTDLNQRPELRYRAIIINPYPGIDFAVLQITRDADGRNIPAGTLELPSVMIDPEQIEANRLPRGARINAEGYPGSGDGYLTFASGVVSLVRNCVQPSNLSYWYQTDAQVDYGFSGGLAQTEDGSPFGIVTGIITAGESRPAVILPFDFLLRVADGDVTVAECLGETDDSAQGESQQPQSTPGPVQSTVIVLPQSPVGPFENVALRCGSEGATDSAFTVTALLAPGSYRATLIGMQQFDPLLAVDGVCTPDNSAAREYVADFSRAGTGTGPVYGTARSTQIEFQVPATEQGASAVQFTIGGQDGSAGEFIFILEGAKLSAQLNANPYSIALTDSLASSEIALNAYMLGVSDNLDPALVAGQLGESAFNPFEFPAGSPIACGNAGSECWGDNASLVDSSVVEAGANNYRGESADAMLSFDLYTLLSSGVNRIDLLATSSTPVVTRQEYLFVLTGGIG